MVDQLSTLRDAVEKHIVNEKQTKEEMASDIKILKQGMFIIKAHIEDLNRKMNEVQEKPPSCCYSS